MENWVNLLKVVLLHGPVADESYRFITYRNSSITLDQSRYDYVMGNLPDKWSNAAEKLIRFDVRLEKNSNEIKYFVEVEKTAFDFRLREERKFALTKTPSDKECEELYNILTDIFNKYSVEKYEKLYDSVLENLKDKSIAALKVTELRNQLLQESDIYMLPDFPITEEQKQSVTEYRQQLRDLTDQENWPDNIQLLEMPVSPINQGKQIQIMNEYLLDSRIMDTRLKNIGADILSSNSDEGIKNYMSIVMKLNILSSLYNLKIPMFVEQNSGEFNDIMNSAKESYEQFNELVSLNNIQMNNNEESLSRYQEAIQNLDSKIKLVDETISKYNLNFTINDIIEDMLKTQQLDNEAEELLNDIESEGN
jgi:hypothetical protein